MTDSLFVLLGSAVVAGLASSVHCVGMCGAAVAATSVAAPVTSMRARSVSQIAVVVHRVSIADHLKRPLMFNLGRIASYAFMGAAVGALGQLGSNLVIGDIASARSALFVLAQLVMLVTGLYLIGFTALLRPLERAASHLWKHVSPLAKHLLPASTPLHALMLGAIWGWIPCGLVYAMLMTAMASADAASGALVMVAFGLGTFPAMLGAAALMGALRGRDAASRLRLVAGAIVIVMAVIGLARTPEVAGQSAWAALGKLCTSINIASSVRP